MATAVAHRLVTATPFALTAGAKTALMAIAPSGHGLTLVAWGVSFNGVTAADVGALVEIVTSTQGAAGTSGVAPTITQVRGRATGGQAPTGGSNYTAEPTTLVRVEAEYLTPNGGLLPFQIPLGREIECDSSGGTIKALGIRINVTANVTALCWMEVENL